MPQLDPNAVDTLSPAQPGASLDGAVRTWRGIAWIVLAWLVLQIGGLFSPGLLDDVDSIYIEIAREMLHRHDFVTPYIDGVRFFDKPPLMYWIAAGSMTVFGEQDWAARLPMALATLALFFSVYALGRRFYGERGGLYSALAMATAVGPYLYTRFFIPDILICLWMTLGVHLFLVALDRTNEDRVPDVSIWRHEIFTNTALLPCLAFAAVLALNLLTKGLIGLIFPLAFVLLYLTLTRQGHRLPRRHLLPSAIVFLLIAAPWHILAALRNPVIALPSGLGLPGKAGWVWFYLYNEHIARFLGRRIPHDYGNTPVWLFWLYAAIWIMPWTTFLPGAIVQIRRALGHCYPVSVRAREAALSLTIWAAVVLFFFSVSSRQEYYSLPAIPAFVLMAGGFLARADLQEDAHRSALRWSLSFLVPLSIVLAAVCGWFALTAPHPAPGTDLAKLLAGNPDLYNLSLGHIFDLTGAAMGLFRAPLAAVALGMIALGPGSYLLRRAGRSYTANLTLAAAMIVILSAAHEGLRRFYPILGSKDLALAINRVRRPGDLVLLDGELTSGSSLIFYLREPVHLVNGRVNGPWFGSFWPDAPPIFEDEASLHVLWPGPRRIFLLTYHEADRIHDLPNAHVLARSGGKTILTNR